MNIRIDDQDMLQVARAALGKCREEMVLMYVTQDKIFRVFTLQPRLDISSEEMSESCSKNRALITDQTDIGIKQKGNANAGD